jgi:hypothetical protein
VRNLLREVLALDEPALQQLLDELAGHPAVEASGWRVREKRLGQERYAARNCEIRQRHEKGESYGQLGIAFGLTPSGIAKVVQRGRVKSVDALPMSTASHR